VAYLVDSMRTSGQQARFLPPNSLLDVIYLVDSKGTSTMRTFRRRRDEIHCFAVNRPRCPLFRFTVRYRLRWYCLLVRHYSTQVVEYPLYKADDAKFSRALLEQLAAKVRAREPQITATFLAWLGAIGLPHGDGTTYAPGASHDPRPVLLEHHTPQLEPQRQQSVPLDAGALAQTPRNTRLIDS
jgi:hypothetical protein